jgi:hypothetical protein
MIKINNMDKTELIKQQLIELIDIKNKYFKTGLKTFAYKIQMDNIKYQIRLLKCELYDNYLNNDK